jgi:hypothetical protein
MPKGTGRPLTLAERRKASSLLLSNPRPGTERDRELMDMLDKLKEMKKNSARKNAFKYTK